MNKVIFFVLLAAATLASSCGGTSSASQNAAVQDKKLSVPANVRNSEPDKNIYLESALLLSLPFGSNETIYQNKPLVRAQFDDLLKQYIETHAPEDYHAYLKSDSRIEYGRAIDVFKRLREKQIVDVRLVTSPTTGNDSPKTEGFNATERKEEVLSVEILAEDAPSRISKEPTASNLTLEIDKDKHLRLDGKNITSDELLAELSRIFAYRTKVYWMREGTNVIDQSVRLKAPRSMSFGEVVETIDLLRDARAIPIYLQIEN